MDSDTDEYFCSDSDDDSNINGDSNYHGRTPIIFDIATRGISEDGCIIMYDPNAGIYNYFAEVERLSDDLVKIKSLPKAIQVETIPGSMMSSNILLLLEDRRVLYIEKRYPNGIELNWPPIARMYEHDEGIYLLDQSGRLALLQYKHHCRDPVNIMNRSFDHLVAENITMISFHRIFSNVIYIINRDNDLVVIVDGRIASTIHLDKEVHKMSYSMILYADGTIQSIDHKDPVSSSVANWMDLRYYILQDRGLINRRVTHFNNQLNLIFIITDRGEFISYKQNKSQLTDETIITTDAIRIRQYMGLDYVELADGRMWRISYRFNPNRPNEQILTCKLIDIDEYNQLEKRLSMTKPVKRD